MKNIVVFGIDGVLADFEGQLVFALYEKFGTSAYRNRHLFSLEERYGSNPEMLKYAQELTNNPNFYYPLEQIEGGVRFVNMCVSFGAEIVFVSSRPELAEKFTRRWLDKHVSISDYALNCGIKDKVEFLEGCQEDVDFIVEDNPKNIKDLKNAGFDVLCWDQDWNQGIFPRLYKRMDGVVMIWQNEETESEPFRDTTVVGG